MQHTVITLFVCGDSDWKYYCSPFAHISNFKHYNYQIKLFNMILIHEKGSDADEVTTVFIRLSVI